MSFPHLPMLLYVEPTIYPAARRILIYLAEKQIPSSVVTPVPPADDPASKEYPPPKSTTVPALAIRKTADGARNDPQSYQYIGQSCAILEYLEDLCDQNADISPVPSLRGGDDYIKRMLIRGLMAYADEGFQNIANVVLFGSKPYNDMMKYDYLNVAASRSIREFGDDKTFTRMDEQVAMTTDFAAVSSGKPGSVTLGDIVIFVLLSFGRDCYAFDATVGHPNLQKLVEAFEKRETATAGIPGGVYPDWVEPFRKGWIEGTKPNES